MVCAEDDAQPTSELPAPVTPLSAALGWALGYEERIGGRGMEVWQAPVVAMRRPLALGTCSGQGAEMELLLRPALNTLSAGWC